MAEQSKRDKELQFPVHSRVKGFEMPLVFPSGKDKHMARAKTKQTNPNPPPKKNPNEKNLNPVHKIQFKGGK